EDSTVESFGRSEVIFRSGGQRPAVGRRRARTGTMMAAAVRWIDTRTIRLAAPNDITKSGTTDSAVRATVMRTNVDRGWAARRHCLAMRSPSMAPSSVIWAKPGSGIASPSISNDTPAAWAMAAIAVVTAAATPPLASAGRHSGRVPSTVVLVVTGVVVSVVVSAV